MTWNKMTRKQQDYVRRLASRYGATVSQVAKNIDTYAALDRGEITATEAEQITGNEIRH